EDDVQRVECRDEGNDDVAGIQHVGLAIGKVTEEQRLLKGASSQSMEALLMNSQHVDEDCAVAKIQILSPINGALNKKRDFGKRNKDTLGLERNGPIIAVGLPLNSSVEHMPSCCSRLVNIASEMG
ncbi:hypothetical protein Ancab_016419, partial [Ancistrocladus abbreviatus]